MSILGKTKDPLNGHQQRGLPVFLPRKSFGSWPETCCLLLPLVTIQWPLFCFLAFPTTLRSQLLWAFDWEYRISFECIGHKEVKGGYFSFPEWTLQIDLGCRGALKFFEKVFIFSVLHFLWVMLIMALDSKICHEKL